MKAIALLSGGLDSTLAIRIILDQGIEVTAVNFFTPFCQCNRKEGCGYVAKKAADRFNIEIKICNIFIEYLEIVRNPRYGYGKHLNPCIDCRILMHKKAKDCMREIGASFVISGEVLGQRPMSQHRRALRIIERDSGLEGLILRPLSAKLLPETIPEKQGWVKREKLLAISGRSRKPQIAKALDYGINDYPCPAGGCLLTDEGFSRRMKDLMIHSLFTLKDIELLKIGRHFRISPQAKVIVGRNKEENERLLSLREEEDICFRPEQIKGPIGIGRGSFDQTTVVKAAQIIGRYSDGFARKKVRIVIQDFNDRGIECVIAKSIGEEELKVMRI
jgi:tRNA U34 2-thiouridine synthase MnmA/TrmU